MKRDLAMAVDKAIVVATCCICGVLRVIGKRLIAIGIFTAQKLTLTPKGNNFQSADDWGPGDFGS